MARIQNPFRRRVGGISGLIPLIPVGYMAKQLSARPDWLGAPHVHHVCSVSHCISSAFTDDMPYWKQNGFWFFNSIELIRQLAKHNAISLSLARYFYYEAYPWQFDDKSRQWVTFAPESSLVTNVVLPRERNLLGYDIVSYSGGTCAECSPLSCNNLAQEIAVNQHCLLVSLERAKELLQAGAFAKAEPGPYRILAVYAVVEEDNNV